MNKKGKLLNLLKVIKPLDDNVKYSKEVKQIKIPFLTHFLKLDHKQTFSFLFCVFVFGLYLKM